MKRHGERELLWLLGETIDPIYDAASRERDMSGSDIEIVSAVENAQSGKNFIVVKERFPLTHNNDIAYPFLEILLDESHLSDDFCSREIPCKAFAASCTELAGHRTSYLRGNAY